ncbi:hypothetical protein BJ988_005207 [Nocardioides panzhihuensis]|uniref:Uncharacterized protein n=1 Tax=Nocardioides panzhihuensis TaxID=860243 RepID=A0A7Z0DSG4_9ACTN|nr:hypothetical protein [Nocardioides panzhihuensis]
MTTSIARIPDHARDEAYLLVGFTLHDPVRRE